MPNVELVSSFSEATNSRAIDSALALLADDVRWSRPPDAPITGTRRAPMQVRKMWRALIDSLESFEVEPTGLRRPATRCWRG